MPRPLTPLLALLLALAACKEEPAPPPTEPPSEEGDWRDEGPFTTCTFTPSACESPAGLPADPGCDASAAEGLGEEGVYTLHVRTTLPGGVTPSFRTGALRPVTDGGTGHLVGLPLVTRGEGGYFGAARQLTDGGTLHRAIRGCARKAPDTWVGCYAECRNGKPSTEGSFEAVRVLAPPEGEAQASGLSLLSESPVSRGTAVDVYVTHGHAYVVSLGGGLFVYDVRDPRHPVLTKHVYSASDNSWNGVWSEGDTLYVASADRGILVFDLSDPGAPTRVREVPSSRANVHTVFTRGGLLFGASADPDGVVLIFDIRNPAAPVLLSKFQPAGFDPRRSYGPHDMFAFEDTLYVNYWGTGYVTVDLRDPEQPREWGRYRYENSTSHANAVGRFGERLIAFEGGEDWGAHLRVLDVTDPAAPRRIGEWRLREHISIHNMVLVGTRLYVAHYQDGVRVLDVSVPETPRQVAHFHTFWDGAPGSGESFYDGAIGIRVPGDGFIYAVDTSRGLLILREE
ncbi:hypothetical protein P2318_06235 [Myxococcaceae bacterium GXIMD 01537]